MAGTVISQLTAEQFAQRLVAMFPGDWAGSDAAQSGIFHDLLVSLGKSFSEMQESIVYTAAATRILTATAPELDLASIDFFGINELPRPVGMSDAAYAQLIITNLFRIANTRPAIADALFNLTGFEPRMLEPWNIFDTGVWGFQSYWNVDTPENPGRWGGYYPYQGFIETPSPQIPAIGPNNPILCWGDSAYWNVPGYFFGVIALPTNESVFGLVDRLRSAGTTVWVKVVNAPAVANVTAPGAPTGIDLTNVSPTSVGVSWITPTTGTTPFNYQVQFRITGQLTFSSGPSTSFGQNFVTITGLSPITQYDVRVVASNPAGSSASAISHITTLKIPPSPATNLRASTVQATAVTLAWNAPTTGTQPFTYTVQYRINGTINWNVFSAGSATTVTIINLQPVTTYDFEVVTTNQ